MADKLPLADFAAKIKAKYPEYKDVEDSVLVDRILKKYPQYTGAVDYKLKKKVGGEDLQTGAENSLPTPTFDESNAQYAQIAEDAILRDQAKQNFPVNLGIEQQPQTGFGTSITGQGLTKQEVLTGAKPDWHGAQSQRLAELHAGWQAANPDIEAPMRLMQEIESNRPQVREAIPESGLKRTKDRLKIGYNSLLDGIGSLITEATDLGLQFQALTQQAGQGAIAETNLNNFRKNLAPSFRSALTDVIGANLSDNTINRYKNETVTAALSGVAASVPAMVGSRLRTIRFFLQGADAAMQSLYENDINDDLSNIEKTVYASLVGLASAYLEKAGFDKIFKTNTNQVAAYIANKTLADAAKSGKKITGDALTQFLNQNLSEVSNRFVRTGVRGIEGFITEGLTGSAQEAATIGAEYGLNAIKGKEIFDLKGLDSAIARIGEAGFLEAIGGGVLGSVSGIISGAKRNAVYNNIKAINKIDSMLDNEELSDETKESLIKMKISLGKQIESDLQVSLDDFNKLSKKAQDEIRALNEQAASNQEVIDDPNVDEEIKKTAEERVKQIDAQIDDIVKEDAKRPKEAADVNLDELPDDVREEIDQKNQRIQEINIEKARLRSEGEVQSDRIGALNEEERRLYEEINQLAQAERTQGTAQTSEQVEDAQKSETSKDSQPSTDNLSTQQNEESTQLPADGTEGSSKVSLGGQDATAQPVVEEKPKAKRDRKADENANQPVEEDRDTKLLRDSYNRLTEGMTAEQIEADPDLVRMRDRIGQLSGTQKNVTPAADPTEIAVAYAPLRARNVTSISEDSSVRDSADYKAFQTLVQDAAKAIGIPISNSRDTWGGYVDSETGRPVQEVSNVMTVRATPEQARLLAAVIGQNAPEMQDSVLVGSYSSDGQGSEYVIGTGSFENAQNALPLLKENGIEYFTLDKNTGDIIILDLDGGIAGNINGLIENLKKNGQLTKIEHARTNAEFIGQNDYGRIIEEARNKDSSKNWGDLDAAIERAKRGYADKSNRPVKSGTPELGESRGDRTGRGDTGHTKKLEGAPTVEGATGPDPVLNEVARKYAESIGIKFNRQTEYVVVDVDRAKRIAKAYEEMEHNPSDPVVKEAYENLIRQIKAQYDALSEAGYVFYFYDETNDPYNGNPWEAMRDLRANKKMAVFATEAGYGSSATDLDVSDNPLLQDTGIEWGYGSPDGPKKRVTANDLFRAVHDAFGHGLEGAGFRARGEENAWQAHARLFTGSAIGALTTETRGQNSWLNFGPYGEHNRKAKVEDTIFADQKIGLMPEWTWKEGFDGVQYDTPSVSDSKNKATQVSPQTVEKQTQEKTSDAVQERKTKEVSLDESSRDSKEVGGKVREQTEAREKPVVEQKPTKQEVEVKPVTDADLPKKNGQVKQVAVAPDIQAKITMSESLDGEPIFVVQMESDGKVIVDKNGDDTYEFVSAKDAVKFINSKQRGYKLPKGESAKKADDTPSSTPKKGSLPVPKHLEIADYEFSYDIDEDGKYQIYEKTTEIGIGPKFDSAEEVVEFWEKNKYKVTSSGVEAAIRANKKGIDIVSQWRDKKKEGQRIKPAKEEPTGPVTPIGKMIGTLADKLNATIIYSKPGSKRAAGTYNPRNTLITIRNAGDIDTVAHEVGHYIDDAFGVLNTAPKESDNEIKWFYDRGGSNPPDSFSKQQKKEYLRREGIGEFIRAYIVNPEGAKEKAPVLYEHIKNTIPKEVIDAIEEFSREVRNYHNSPASDKMLANVELVPLPDKKGFLEWILPEGEPNELVFDWRDSLTSKIFEGLHMARKAYNFATKLSGTPDLLGVSLFDIYARTFAGVNGKINSIFKKGMIDINGKLLKDKDGNRMTMKWLFEPLEGDTVEDVERASHDVIKLLIAERTKEYAKKFGRDDELTGIGGGLETDLDVAENYLKEFDEMAKADPVYAKAIREAANRYRQYAESALKYYYDAGRLSEEGFKAIKDGNEFYVSLARVKEVGPEEESLNIGRLGPRANLGAVREALRKSKGGTRKIKNPYLSLLENVNNMIHEADRNMVMQKFVEPLRSTRKMGENEARNLAQIGAKVNESGDNTITIYANGHKEIWKFDVEVYKALKALENITPNLALKIMSLPGKVLKFTVTTAPPFAARNLFRDTVSRLILSNNNSKLFDMFYNDEDKRLFEVYGGSQAGHYITSRKAYYTMMRDTMSEVARKNVLLDPRKIGRIADRYYRFLESAENVNRIAEFKAAYEKAKKAGLPDREAGMYAAYQARDLLDFAVAGHWIKVLNQIIPFTNAAIQGLRRAGRHMKDKPLQFAGRLAVYSVLPTLIERALVYSTGDDDEYNKLPYWQRDLYWNFKIPMLTDKWISIPKPFELGIPGSFVSRAISKSLGDEKAYDGFFKSTAELLVPVDESVVLMGWKPLIEVMMNHDMFRQKPIIPVWEQHLKLSKREGTKYSSSLGKMLSQTLGYAGVEVDPRNVDHIVKGFFSTYGDYALRLSNWIGRNEYSQKFNLAEMTSFVKERPIANGRDVLAVYELAARNGKTQSAPVKRLKKMVREYYDANGVKERKEAAIRIYKYAEKVRADLERLDKNN